jgi:hypothetical protein
LRRIVGECSPTSLVPRPPFSDPHVARAALNGRAEFKLLLLVIGGVDICPKDLSFLGLLLTQKNMRAASKRAARPPTTPPTIAPVGELLGGVEEDAAVGESEPGVGAGEPEMDEFELGGMIGVLVAVPNDGLVFVPDDELVVLSNGGLAGRCSMRKFPPPT